MAGDADRQGRTDAYPLGGLAKLSPCQLQALKSRWMTTIDAFVATAATDQGRMGLCQALDIGQEELDSLLQDARDALGDDRYRELMEARAGGPTGALWDEKEQRKATDGSAEGG